MNFFQENVAGSTLLLAVLYNGQLFVANVGDSRGVMCDNKENVIPMSFDHKPQQTRELKRIQEAGGFVQFKGVWRVAGILATSRALGDYPLKEKNFVIAEPDILAFNLNDHKYVDYTIFNKNISSFFFLIFPFFTRFFSYKQCILFDNFVILLFSDQNL